MPPAGLSHRSVGKEAHREHCQRKERVAVWYLLSGRGPSSDTSSAPSDPPASAATSSAAAAPAAASETFAASATAAATGSMFTSGRHSSPSSASTETESRKAARSSVVKSRMLPSLPWGYLPEQSREATDGGGRRQGSYLQGGDADLPGRGFIENKHSTDK